MHIYPFCVSAYCHWVHLLFIINICWQLNHCMNVSRKHAKRFLPVWARSMSLSPSVYQLYGNVWGITCFICATNHLKMCENNAVLIGACYRSSSLQSFVLICGWLFLYFSSQQSDHKVSCFKSVQSCSLQGLSSAGFHSTAFPKHLIQLITTLIEPNLITLLNSKVGSDY